MSQEKIFMPSQPAQPGNPMCGVLSDHHPGTRTLTAGFRTTLPRPPLAHRAG